MDKQQACHAIALESAKAFITSNMPEYINTSGTTGLAKDMAQKYIDAYLAAKEVFDKTENKTKAKMSVMKL